MKNGFASNIVRCPFYRHEKIPVIYCKGVSEKSYINHAFSDKRAYKDFREFYCIDKYERCPIFKMLCICEGVVDDE